MKQCLLLSLAVAAGGCLVCFAALLNDPNTLPIAKTSGVGVTTAVQEMEPSIVLVRTRSEGLGEAQVTLAELVLVNPLDVPITYHGYRMDSWETRPPVGEISPLYSRQVKEGDGWKDSPIGWCGTGADEMTVPSKQAGRFSAYLESPAKTSRVGVRCQWKAEEGKTETLTIWTNDIVPDEATRTRKQ